MRDVPGRLALARAKQSAGAPVARLKNVMRKWCNFRAAAGAAAVAVAPQTADNGQTSVSDVRVAPLIQTEWDKTTVYDQST